MNPSPEAVRGGYVDVKKAMATLLAFVLALGKVPLEKLVDSGSGGTPNMKFFRAVFGYIRDGLQAPLLAFLKLQEEQGHCLIEPFTASHGQLHIGCAGVALWWAIINGHHELAAALTRWWQREFRLCRLMPGDGASGPWGPGARDENSAPGGQMAGNNKARSIAYKVALGGKITGAKDKGNVGALALSKLSPDVRAEVLFTPKEFVLAGELRVANRDPATAGTSLGAEMAMSRGASPADYIGWFPHGIPGAVDSALAAGVWDGKTFISATVDQAALDRIALCSSLPVVIPAAKPF